jgi:hypothetical protein
MSFLPRFESQPPPPDISPLNLTTAGSRRTVYLGEENKADKEKPTTSNGNGDAAPTFLMYNKISTTIGGKESPPASLTNGTNGSGSEAKSKSEKKKNEKNRESAIWYKKMINLKPSKKPDKSIN